MGNNAYTVIKKEQRNEKRSQLDDDSRFNHVHSNNHYFSKGNLMNHSIAFNLDKSVDYCDAETLRALNHAVTACCYLTKGTDPQPIKKGLIKAAEFLKLLNHHNPIVNSQLDVDWFLGEIDPWRKKG